MRFQPLLPSLQCLSQEKQLLYFFCFSDKLSKVIQFIFFVFQTQNSVQNDMRGCRFVQGKTAGKIANRTFNFWDVKLQKSAAKN